MANHLGIDPGLKNIGIVVTDDDGKLVFSQALGLEQCQNGVTGFVQGILRVCSKYEVQTCAIERFVTFKGIQSKVSEEILMLIGALRYAIENYGHLKVSMYRSIDWKPALCKYLVKELRFDNPSQKFDKQFSKAAASAITKEKITNDHIADAIGLSRMWATELRQG